MEGRTRESGTVLPPPPPPVLDSMTSECWKETVSLTHPFHRWGNRWEKKGRDMPSMVSPQTQDFQQE